MLFSFVIFTSSVFAADYEITKYDITADILENGDMKVVEELTYDFDEDMNGVYRMILYSYIYNGQKDNLEPASKRYQASGVSNLKVEYSDTSFENMKVATKNAETLLSNGMEGYYSAETVFDEEKKVIIKVYSPVKDGHKKYVRYEYTVKDAIVNYNDYAEIYWNFIGGDWECDIKDVTILVNLPQETNLKAYGHTFGNITDFSNDDKTITFKISRLAEGTAADIRAVFPNNILRSSNISKQVNESYDFDELEKVENVLAENMEKYHKYLGVFYPLTILSILSVIIVSVFSGKSKDGRIKNYKKAEVYTNILDNFSLTDYNRIYSAYGSSVTGNMMIATLMDLTHKKVITMDARKTVKNNKDKYEYMVKLNKEARFEELTEYEKILINYIFFKKCKENIDLEDINGEEFELNERFKELSKQTSLAEKVREKMMRLDTKNKDKYYMNAKFSQFKVAIFTSCALLIAFVSTLFALCPTTLIAGYSIASIVIPVMHALITCSSVGIKGVNLKEEYVDEYNRLKGLYRYLREYSLLKDRYPLEIALWDKYMVFACFFGIADKVAKEFKEELVLRGMSEDEIYTYYPYMYMGTHISSFSSGISSAAYSGSGSSSSGGFSGGGGGRRRWWRWRCLLTCIIVYLTHIYSNNIKRT